jgi:hypothetical protein
MRKMVISLTATFILVLAVTLGSLPTLTHAQTQNHTTKIVVTEAFTFPNECTGEMLDVTDTTVVTCHAQLRANGTYSEKCQIRQDIDAVEETTGVTFHGSGIFKDEFTTTDPDNFSFTNLGRVNLISPGSDLNLVLHFDEIVIVENSVLTTDSHVVSADCRGSQP